MVPAVLAGQRTADTDLRAARPPSAAETASPEGRPVLDLEALQSLALEHNPTLIQAEAFVRAESAKAAQAGAYLNPRVGFIAEPVPAGGAQGEFTGVYVEQEIVTGGKLSLSRRKYLARSRAAEHLRAAQQLSVRNDVRIRYFRALAAERVLEIREALLRSANDQQLTVQEMANLGQADATELLEAQIEWQHARLDWLMAANARRAALSDLGAVVGADMEDADIVGSLEGEIELIDFEAAHDRIVQGSPQLAAARQEVEVDEISILRERREALPNLAFQVGAGRNPALARTDYRASVAVEIPFFNRNRGTVLQARADLDRQRAEVRRRELELRRILADRYKAYLTAVQHVRKYREVVLPKAREIYRTRLAAYEEGRENWPRVLESQRSFYGERAAYVGYLAAWREEDAAIQGMLLVDGLAAPTGPLPAGHIDAVAQPR